MKRAVGKSSHYVVILAGGSGERFWPLSTSERPKQFIRLFGGTSLLRQAVERVRPLVPMENILVVTAKNLAEATRTELPDLPPENLLLEPRRKNTGPALATSLGDVLRRGGEGACVAVLAADQLIEKPAVFRRLLAKAFQTAARNDTIVTLGVKPTFPATGYGYIDATRKIFVEKPDLETAKRYLASGKYVWNAGLFIFRAGSLLEICRTVAPELATLALSVRAAKTTNAALARLYPRQTSISFDYAVMEKTRRIDVVSGEFGWDDVGSYSALARHLAADRESNVRLGATRQLDCQGCTFVAEGVRISAFGLKNVVVATRAGEVLVMAAERAPDLKALLSV